MSCRSAAAGIPGRHLFPAPAFRLVAADADPAKVAGVLETGRADEAVVGYAGRLGLDAALVRRRPLPAGAAPSRLQGAAGAVLRGGGGAAACRVARWSRSSPGCGIRWARRWRWPTASALATRVHGTPDDIPLSPRRLLAEARAAGLIPESACRHLLVAPPARRRPARAVAAGSSSAPAREPAALRPHADADRPRTRLRASVAMAHEPDSPIASLRSRVDPCAGAAGRRRRSAGAAAAAACLRRAQPQRVAGLARGRRARGARVPHQQQHRSDGDSGQHVVGDRDHLPRRRRVRRRRPRSAAAGERGGSGGRAASPPSPRSRACRSCGRCSRTGRGSAPTSCCRTSRAFAGAVALGRLAPRRWPALVGGVAIAATALCA